jgi:hypothetical protein
MVESRAFPENGGQIGVVSSHSLKLIDRRPIE